MKIITTTFIALTCLLSSSLYSFQFANTIKQRVMQHAAWQRAAQFGTTYAPKIKKFAGFVDKAIPAGLLTTSIITSQRNNLELEPLSADTAQETFVMTENLCKKLDVNFSDIQLYKVTKNNTGNFEGTGAATENSLFGKNKIVLFNGLFKRPSSQQEAIVAHELIHIKNCDSLTQSGLFMAIAGTSVGSFRLAHYILKRTCQSNMIANFLLSPLRSISVPLITAFHPSFKGTTASYDYDENGKISKITVDDGGKSAGFGLRLAAAYARFCEKRADIDSAKLAGTAQGNIDALQKHVDIYDSYTSALAQHPCPKERIDYLKPYVQGK